MLYLFHLFYLHIFSDELKQRTLDKIKLNKINKYKYELDKEYQMMN